MAGLLEPGIAGAGTRHRQQAKHETEADSHAGKGNERHECRLKWDSGRLHTAKAGIARVSLSTAGEPPHVAPAKKTNSNFDVSNPGCVIDF
jgi:hypothetical protein